MVCCFVRGSVTLGRLTELHPISSTQKCNIRRWRYGPVTRLEFVLARQPISPKQAVLRASLDVGALDINKFSRWLRAIVSWLLVRNAAADRNKASAYIEQAVEVMRDDGEAVRTE